MRYRRKDITMQNIIFTVDSSSDMPSSLLAKHNISVLPFYINFGDETYRDGVDIDRATLYEKVEKTGVMPKTAAIPPAIYGDFFAEKRKDADAVIHFSIGSGLSSSYQNATLAASEYDNVFVVDTNTLSSAEALVILHALDLAKEGKSAKEIVADCVSYKDRCDASFVLDTLDYMKKGGRCSGAAALGANLLGIKPALNMQDGTLMLCKKYRGKLKMVIPKYIEERLAACTPDPTRIFITNSGIDAEIIELAHETVEKSGIFSEIIHTDAGCVISSHCGPGTLGILFATK